MKRVVYLSVFCSIFLSTFVQANNFKRLNQALPKEVKISSITPVFDFDTDGCLPSAAISRTGVQNGGLKPSGGLTAGCRRSDFLNYSNTYHRYACIKSGGNQYCGHFFALYFLKDQILNGIKSGHRHDLEQVAIWTKNGQVIYGGYSAHGKMYNKKKSSIPKQNGHLKFVYHKDGVLTHAFRFAKSNEVAENSYGTFVTPVIVSWYTMYGDGVSNQTLRNHLNAYDYGNAIMPIKDSNFLTNLNKFKPSGFPTFTSSSVKNSH
ncbi:MAG: hypothetical protein CENE_01393 [Candidatus Celerinatantimonas neptuna]|nr:MAG: hypothetical protein CENE_01393 [Candidatus Celerinatantimonas neptuna]